MKKRPRDPNQLGKLIIDIATGQLKNRPNKIPRRQASAAKPSKPRKTAK